MTSSTTYDRTSNRQSGLTLASVLGPIHDDWISQTRRTVEPALSRDASFWDRWTAVRYLDDPFDDHYHHEVALVGSLVPLLPPAVAGRLTILTETLDQSRAQLDQVGRRRGGARAVAVVAREFLDLSSSGAMKWKQRSGASSRRTFPSGASSCWRRWKRRPRSSRERSVGHGCGVRHVRRSQGVASRPPDGHRYRTGGGRL